jgi:hypothetical protein
MLMAMVGIKMNEYKILWGNVLESGHKEDLARVVAIGGENNRSGSLVLALPVLSLWAQLMESFIVSCLLPSEGD